ncbi:MFS transporter [Burkholderia sp. Bp8992]|uniref:MFS transporter n=1 Tax=Burkholderia sp. Bp8992 TaxID=2184554 RepID=UPI000F588361|nr:MFS transporter [Burkholderia sp. Bp8992]RQS26584.1 MFS transporter [Burkholderia sp. Bp8992]
MIQLIDKLIGLKGVVLLQTFLERLALFVLPLYVYQLTGSKQMLGMIVVLEWLPTILLLPIAGWLVDRFGCRACFFHPSILRAVVALMLVLLTGVLPNIALMLLFAALASAANIVAYLSFEKYVASRVPNAQVSSYYSFFSVSQQVNQIAAPLIGVSVIAAFSVQQFFLLYALLFACLAFLFYAVIPKAAASDVERGERVPFRILADRLVRNQRLVTLALCMLLINTVLAVLITLIPDIVIGEYGLGKRDVALLFTSGAVLSGLFHLAYSRPALAGRMKLLGRASVLLIPMFLMAQIVVSGVFFFAVSALTMAISLPFSVWSRTLRNNLLPPEGFASAASIVMVISLLGFPIGGLIVSTLSALPNRWIMFGTGATVFAVVLALLRFGGFWRIESTRDQPELEPRLAKPES